MMFVSFNSNTTGATGGAGTANPSGVSEFSRGFCGVCVVLSLVFCVIFGRSLFALFTSTIAWSVLRSMASYYPLGIFILCFPCNKRYTS